MRILYVIDNLEFGGGERVFLQLASSLKDRHRIYVAANNDGKLAQELQNLKIELIPIDMTRRFACKPIRQISRIVRKKKIDIVHSQGARADFFARIGARTARSPKIVCTVAMPLEGFDVGSLRKKVYSLLDCFSSHFVQRFVVVSDALEKSLTVGRGIAAWRVVRIYNGIEVEKYCPGIAETDLRSQWGIDPAAPLIGAIGRMVWQKGFQYLVEAAAQILRHTPRARFVLVGEGPLRQDLKGLARKLKIDNGITFTGFRSDIRSILSAVDIVAAPSLLEGFPMATLEAMAMAKPVVATQIQGITEQISDGKEGILVPPKDAGALAAAILKLIKDKALSTAVGLAARSKVERSFAIGKMVQETEKLYLSLQ